MKIYNDLKNYFESISMEEEEIDLMIEDAGEKTILYVCNYWYEIEEIENSLKLTSVGLPKTEIIIVKDINELILMIENDQL